MDLTETWDIVRQQPVIEIDRITHRRNAIYHALLPGQLEHKLLMGMPKNPAFSPRSTSCLLPECQHYAGRCIVAARRSAIDKRHPDDGAKAQAAFRGHSSLKHVVVVDTDIDIYDPNDVEWAIATRFQAGRDATIFRGGPLVRWTRPHCTCPVKSRTAKMGLDATIPWDTPTGPTFPEHFERVPFPHVDVGVYLDE